MLKWRPGSQCIPATPPWLWCWDWRKRTFTRTSSVPRCSCRLMKIMKTQRLEDWWQFYQPLLCTEKQDPFTFKKFSIGLAFWILIVIMLVGNIDSRPKKSWLMDWKSLNFQPWTMDGPSEEIYRWKRLREMWRKLSTSFSPSLENIFISSFSSNWTKKTKKNYVFVVTK